MVQIEEVDDVQAVKKETPTEDKVDDVQAVKKETSTEDKAMEKDGSITFEVTGKMGMQCQPDSGVVSDVSKDGRAEELGVRVGWQVVSLDGEPFTATLLQEKHNGPDQYKITFEKKAPVAAAAAPAAPAAPEFKLSQLVPMAVMFGLQKVNLEEMGLVHHVEALFALIQIICLGLLYVVYTKILAVPDDGKKIKVPEVKQFGQVVAPAVVQTYKEYDLGKFKEQAKQAGMGAVVLGGVYCKWGYLMPLVLQVVMTPLQLYESPLFQIHVVGKPVTRPFPTPNPFGMPSAPTPAAEEVEDEPAVEAKKDQ